jgi:zinc protease
MELASRAQGTRAGRRGALVKLATSLPTLELPRVESQLSCGATLLVSPRPGAPVCAARIHVRGGPSLDPAEKAGLAFLVGALADQGTEEHDEAELAALLEPAGGEIAGDANGIGGTIANDAWKLLLQSLAEMVRSATYPEREFARQKKRLESRLTVERDDPRVQGGQRFKRLVYGRHWLGRPTYGSLETIARIQPEDLRARRREQWVGSRLIIGVCGDVEAAAVHRVLDRALDSLPRGEPFVPDAIELPAPGPRADAFSADRAQVHVFLGHLGIRRNDPDYARLVVMDHVLGTGPGFTNRISRRLRDELGLAYTVHADIHSSAGLLPGTFTAYIGTSPEKLATATEGFLSEIRRMQDRRVGSRELAVAKDYLLGSFVLGFERASRRVHYLVSSALYGLPEDNLERLPKEFAAVTPADVQRVARAHLFPERCCLVAAGPTSRPALLQLLARTAS